MSARLLIVGGDYVAELRLANAAYSVEVVVWEVCGWPEDGSPPVVGGDFTTALPVTQRASAEVALRLTVKWDGCSHAHFGCQREADGYVHLCGSAATQQFAAMLCTVHHEALEMMRAAGTFTDDRWPDGPQLTVEDAPAEWL